MTIYSCVYDNDVLSFKESLLSIGVACGHRLFDIITYSGKVEMLCMLLQDARFGYLMDASYSKYDDIRAMLYLSYCRGHYSIVSLYIELLGANVETAFNFNGLQYNYGFSDFCKKEQRKFKLMLITKK